MQLSDEQGKLAVANLDIVKANYSQPYSRHSRKEEEVTHRQWIILQQALCSFRDLVDGDIHDMAAAYVLHWDDKDGPLPTSEELDDLVTDVICDLKPNKPVSEGV